MLPGGTTNNEQGKIELLSLWAVGRLSFAITAERGWHRLAEAAKRSVRTQT